MKTPDEIKKGLECCVAKTTGLTVKDCDIECPYFHEGVFCKNALHGDVKQIIQQLESRLAQAERERDALLDIVNREKPGKECVNYEKCFELTKKSIVNWMACPVCRKFQWRGVCPENTKEEPNAD